LLAATTCYKINNSFYIIIINVYSIKHKLNVTVKNKKLIVIACLFKKNMLNSKLNIKLNINYIVTIKTLTQKTLLIKLSINNCNLIYLVSFNWLLKPYIGSCLPLKILVLNVY
jgi:hypothetical protein